MLKRRHGLNRSRYPGLDGMRRWVGLGVIVDNLIKHRSPARGGSVKPLIDEAQAGSGINRARRRCRIGAAQFQLSAVSAAGFLRKGLFAPESS